MFQRQDYMYEISITQDDIKQDIFLKKSRVCVLLFYFKSTEVFYIKSINKGFP